MIKNQLEIKKLEYNLGSWLQIRVHCIWCYPHVESKSLMVSKSLVELKSLVDYKSMSVIVNVLCGLEIKWVNFEITTEILKPG